MNAQLWQSFRVYLSQRWALPVILVVLVLVSGGAVMAVTTNFNQNMLPMLTNAVGLPAMGIAFWVTSTAKWQFVNPRARLLPGFAPPHLLAITAWLAAAMFIYPAAIGLASPVNPCMLVAYATGCGCLFTWAMHTGRPVFVLGALAVMFAPIIPWMRPLWIGASLEANAVGAAAAALGVLGIAVWMRRLAQLDEESDEYSIPTQAQSGKASRMEKSEARRNIARQLRRSRLASLITDWWHDPLTDRRASSPAERRALLRYGMSGVPAWFQGLAMTAMILAIVGLTAVMTGAASNADENKNGFAPVFAQASIFTILGPMIVSQQLAMRRPRMSTELLFPHSRRGYVDGLFQAMARDSLLIGAASVAVVVAFAVLALPDQITLARLGAAALAWPTAMVAVYATGMGTALIESGFKRVVVMLIGLYAMMGVLGSAAFLFHQGAHGYAAALTAGLLVVGLLLTRFAYRRWLRAELG